MSQPQVLQPDLRKRRKSSLWFQRLRSAKSWNQIHCFWCRTALECNCRTRVFQFKIPVGYFWDTAERMTSATTALCSCVLQELDCFLLDNNGFVVLSKTQRDVSFISNGVLWNSDFMNFAVFLALNFRAISFDGSHCVSDWKVLWRDRSNINEGADQGFWRQWERRNLHQVRKLCSHLSVFTLCAKLNLEGGKKEWEIDSVLPQDTFWQQAWEACGISIDIRLFVFFSIPMYDYQGICEIWVKGGSGASTIFLDVSSAHCHTTWWRC